MERKIHIPTWYYTTNLHTGAFMLPKYVEDLLEEEENNKSEQINGNWMWWRSFRSSYISVARTVSVFTELMIASRTKSKCDALKAQLEGKTDTVITTAQVDADKVEELEALIRSYKPDAVLNVALPYQDLTIMEACLRTGVDYIDTANYEAENTDDPQWRAIYEKRCKEKGFTAYFDYSWQWDLNERFKEAGLTALLRKRI